MLYSHKCHSHSFSYLQHKLNRDVDLASSPQKLWFHDMRALEKQKKEAWVDCVEDFWGNNSGDFFTPVVFSYPFAFLHFNPPYITILHIHTPTDCLLMGLLVGLTNKPHQTGPQMSSSSKANPTDRSLLMLCGREGRPDERNPSPVGS
jgi:hypothetical protein